MLDADSKTFVLYVAIREQKKLVIDPVRKAQIETQSRAKSRAWVRALIFNKTPTEIPAEYYDYSNVILSENAVEIPKNTGINKHTIKLEEHKQLLFGPICNLGLVELETLKIYIETNLAIVFIWLSKSPAEAFIVFDKKPG